MSEYEYIEGRELRLVIEMRKKSFYEVFANIY
jgi:hypothetical protein